MTEANQNIMKPVPDISRAGWKLKTTDSKGNESPLAASGLQATHTRMGVIVSYGLGPDGYDQWGIREPNGGGSVIIPYLWINGELYIGANRQKRSFTGGLVTEVPRGFSLPHETHAETAKREFQEETGIVKPLAERVKSLGGKRKPVNFNSTYLIANPRKGEGVKFFGVKIEPSEVEVKREGKKAVKVLPDGTKQFVDDPRRTVYKFTPEFQGEIKELNEKIKPQGIRFFHASLLNETSDGFTLEAIGRLAV